MLAPEKKIGIFKIDLDTSKKVLKTQWVALALYN